MIDQVQQRVRPILDDAKQAIDSIVAITARMDKGQGTLGQLVAGDTLARQAEQMVATAQQQISDLGKVIATLDDLAKQADTLTRVAASRQEGVPELLRRVDAILANLQTTTHDLTRASPQLTTIARNMANGTANLPALLTQTQVTAEQLQRLLAQLQGLWLLGGGSPPHPEPSRLPVSQIQP
jgi:phospholipid/cholesterol/gamma-HCH transport system substrate-binding protein